MNQETLQLLFPIGILIVFFLVLIIPQKKREKKVKEMLNNLRVGDNVRTIGGIYGKIAALKDNLITIETGPDKCKIVFSKSAISTVEASDVEVGMDS